ncbi:hypothetical protein D1P53_000565 [Cryptococcus gattii VGV]|nr:hypothetical protein D1P53_000565 [Cryptococcus gattii VGV]
MNPRSLTTAVRSFTRSVPLRTALPAARTFTPQLQARAYSEEKEFHEKEDKRIADLEAAKAESDKKAAEFEEKVKELTKEMQYLRADVQTAVRRSAEEKAKASEFAISSFARALLDTADVLSTALKHVPQPIPADNKDLQSLHTGVELTHKALLKTFESHGVKKLENLKGEQFDPNMHEALFTVPQAVAPKKDNGEPHGPNEIFDVSKEGWTIGSRVLRPAQVGVVASE